MAIVYNIDEALEESRPVIRFRGKEYEVKDLTVKETIKHINEIKQREDRLEKKLKSKIRKKLEEDGVSEEDLEEQVLDAYLNMPEEELFSEYIPIAIDSLTKTLQNFPESVANTITLKEFTLLKQALQKAGLHQVNVEGEERGKK